MVKIVSTEGTVGGEPRIEDTRIQVKDVVSAYRELEWGIERISSEYDLKVQEVLEALKYYYDNMDDFSVETESSVKA